MSCPSLGSRWGEVAFPVKRLVWLQKPKGQRGGRKVLWKAKEQKDLSKAKREPHNDSEGRCWRTQSLLEAGYFVTETDRLATAQEFDTKLQDYAADAKGCTDCHWERAL